VPGRRSCDDNWWSTTSFIIGCCAVSHGDGARVLVHCSQGVSRSCGLVIAYLMWLRLWDFPTAFAEVGGGGVVETTPINHDPHRK